eukprot:GFUD01028749.1.p1 GENE.GFUD01028749.1~~GFUD01028749.1.p1  ORF type:complete len:291 (-),score=59.20 GFUD01028749.1:111-983(-)
MAPVEDEVIPVEVEVIPVHSWLMNIKIVDKAFELPVVTSAYAEIAKLASPLTPLVDNSLTTTITPMVEVGFTTIKTKVEESVVPRLPDVMSKTIHSAVEHVTAAVEKIDTIACGGIDQLTEKVPALREATPELIANSKETATSYAIFATNYVASFSLAQVWLKVVDWELDILEGAIKLTGGSEEGISLSSIKKIHTTANTIRIKGNTMAGTAKAKKIEEASIFGAVLEVSGIAFILGSLGFVGTAKENAEDEAIDEADLVEEVKNLRHKRQDSFIPPSPMKIPTSHHSFM